MCRRSFFVAAGVLALLLFSLGAGLWLLLRYEPRRYASLVGMEGADRRHCSQEFVTEFSTFYNGFQSGGEWYGQFTDTQANCYLAEGLFTQGFDRFLPHGVSDPRVQFEPERVRLYFRYRRGVVNTVVSVVLRVWLPAGEPNALAIKLESLKAGLMPVSAHWLLQYISEEAQANSIDVSWYRHEGMPVALVRFESDRPRPTLQLSAARVEEGTLTVQGHSGGTNAAGPPPPEVKLAQKP